MNCSMQQKLFGQSDRTVEIGQEAVKVLVKEPVREAVHEVLAEEDVLVREHSGEMNKVDVEKQSADESSESADESGGRLSAGKIIPILGVVGIAIALRRIGGDKLNTERIEAVINREEGASMEEDMSKSTPGAGDSTTGEGTGEVDI